MGATRKRGRILKSLLFGLVFLVVLVVAFHGCLISRVGGAFTHEPEEMAEGLSPGARLMVKRAFDGIDTSRMLDYHTHVVGLGVGTTGCKVHPHMQTWAHPIARIKFLVYASACGIEDMDRADAQFVDRLVRLARGFEPHGKLLILAFDQHYDRKGEPVLEKTEFYTPNEYVVELAERYPDVFVPAVSVHPYRKDALEALDKWAARGVRVVKWLPNAMGMDPADPLCEPFYARMKHHGMILLSHAGEEKAVEADEDQKLGNPLKLRMPLDMGLKVIVAHSGSLGKGEDLDSPGKELRDNFGLFMRLMDEPKYEGLVFGEISATLQFNRLPRPITTLLKRKDLHHRLVNGSDYPLPAINVIVRTGALLDAGLIDENQREHLNEIYDYNPLLFDFVAKRSVRLPNTRGGFPPSVFQIHPDLLPVATDPALAATTE